MIGFVVHYRTLDSQGGYWPMTPKGPYPLKKARRVARAMHFKRSPLDGKTYPNNRVRDVRIKLRVELP